MEDIKRKHHFVFQAYMKSWLNENNEIWVLREREKVFNTGTAGVGFIKDFYTIQELNDDEKKFLHLWLKYMKPKVREQMQGVVDFYLLPAENEKTIEYILKLARNAFQCDKTKLPEDFNDKVLNLNQMVKRQRSNTIEDIYRDIENELIEDFKKIEGQGVEFYYNATNNQKYQFLSNICTQYFRTPAIKRRWTKRNIEMITKYELEFGKEQINSNNIDISKLSFIFFWQGQSLKAYELIKENAHITVLKNQTDIPFINLMADYLDDAKEPKDLILYYPISPSTALLINDEYIENEWIVDLKSVQKYNMKIINASDNFIISNRKDMVERYRL